MIEAALLIVCVVILLFGFVIFFGAPYLPTLRPQIEVALDLLDLQPGETLLEIGSGDGRVLLVAAARDIRAVGYELNPLLVLISRWRTRKYKDLVQVVWGNAWRQEWPSARGVFIFGLPKLMPKLHTKIVQDLQKPIKVASFSFAMPDKVHTREKDGVYLYEYK